MEWPARLELGGTARAAWALCRGNVHWILGSCLSIPLRMSLMCGFFFLFLRLGLRTCRFDELSSLRWLWLGKGAASQGRNCKWQIYEVRHLIRGLYFTRESDVDGMDASLDGFVRSFARVLHGHYLRLVTSSGYEYLVL